MELSALICFRILDDKLIQVAVQEVAYDNGEYFSVQVFQKVIPSKDHQPKYVLNDREAKKSPEYGQH